LEEVSPALERGIVAVLQKPTCGFIEPPDGRVSARLPRLVETFAGNPAKKMEMLRAFLSFCQTSDWVTRSGGSTGRIRNIRKAVWMPGGSRGHLAAAIELTWIVLVLESSVPTTVTFFPANSFDLPWSLN